MTATQLGAFTYEAILLVCLRIYVCRGVRNYFTYLYPQNIRAVHAKARVSGRTLAYFRQTAIGNAMPDHTDIRTKTVTSMLNSTYLPYGVETID